MFGHLLNRLHINTHMRLDKNRTYLGMLPFCCSAWRKQLSMAPLSCSPSTTNLIILMSLALFSASLSCFISTSYSNSRVLQTYPTKFAGCCLANPAEDGSGIKHLEELVTKDGYSAVRFNPYLWPSGQKMTNEIGKAMFAKAGELGIPVGFMCMKGLNLHFPEIEELCTEYPNTNVILDHLGFCKPPIPDEENQAFQNLLELSTFPQVHVKLSALFRVSREPFPFMDVSLSLSQVVSSYGANRIMWGSDFPYVVAECGYEAAKSAVSDIAKAANLSSVEINWILGGTVMKLFPGHWVS